MKQYMKYVKPYALYFLLAPVLMLVEVVGEVVMPKLLANIINIGIPAGDTGYIVRMGLGMAGMALIMMLGGVGGGFFSARASVSFAAALRKDAFAKVQEFSFANIDKFSTGSLVTRLTNDITQLQNIINMGLKMAFRAPGMLIGALIMAVAMNPSLATVIGVVIPILVIALVLVMRVAFPRFNAMQKKLDRLNTSVQENLTNIRVVKSFVREKEEMEKFAEANEDLRAGSIAAFKVVIMTMPIMTLAMNATTLAVVWFAGRQILVGDMAVGDLTAFTTYIVQILISLMMTAMVILNSSRAIASAKRISEILNTKVDLSDETATKKDAVVTKGKVEFKNVCFKYYKDKENYVLDHISFTANPGEIVGIIGGTGSGKTSMVQLIPRLYDCDAGEVLVDGINVKDYSLKHLREGVGMVLQKNVLFSGTIMDNLKWGDEDATLEAVQAAAESAQAHNFVSSFTKGYETELGQGGVNVSGGQKQRLCIARALLKKPKILILDDSTSAVDTATERRIREAFEGELKDTTKIIIAQRISSVKDANRILVIDEGQIVGEGTHEELYKTCEAYREICISQEEKEASA
ncbi:MAG: ABC transporter ATP-binding protein [Lachnospiraceae bacterium]|nr:ABC transporter ATP-binding protein [Lachnospiraceae bacterium]